MRAGLYLSPTQLALYLVVCWCSGVAIGAVGIGGVLLVPVLLLFDVPVEVAAPTALASFALVGCVGCLAYAASGRFPLRQASMLVPGVLVGAVLGALVVPFVPSLARSGLVIAIAIYAGLKTTVKMVRVLRRGAGSATVKEVADNGDAAALPSASAGGGRGGGGAPPPVAPLPPGGEATEMRAADSAALLPAAVSAPRRERAAWAGLGLLVGALSVLTATGGPFVLLPLLLTLDFRLAALEAVALSQACGVAISAACTPVFALRHEPLDALLALWTALAVSAGTPVGVKLALRVRRDYLQLAIGLVLLGIGVSALVKVVQGAVVGRGPLPPGGLNGTDAFESRSDAG